MTYKEFIEAYNRNKRIGESSEDFFIRSTKAAFLAGELRGLDKAKELTFKMGVNLK